MTNRLTIYCLKKIRAQDYMSADEYDNVCYSLEIFLINLFKTTQVYFCAYLFGVLFETFVMNCAYVILRSSANGWHAKSSLNCTLLGIVSFVITPFILRETMFTFNSWCALIVALLVFIGILLYAPADTEKNPLISVSERKRKKFKSLLSVLVLIIFSFIIQNQSIQTLILSGLFIELIMIHPLLYKLTKRSYKNYEKYVEEK